LNPDTLGEFLQGVAGAHASADLPSVQPGSTTIEYDGSVHLACSIELLLLTSSRSRSRRLRAGESIERLRDEQQQVDCPDSSLLLGALPIGFLVRVACRVLVRQRVSVALPRMRCDSLRRLACWRRVTMNCKNYRRSLPSHYNRTERHMRPCTLSDGCSASPECDRLEPRPTDRPTDACSRRSS